MGAKGGITEGPSHKEGGIPMEVKSTGQQVELEGGEGVINKRNMASEKKFEFEGKDMTICEIASEINSADGNGVQIDCGNVTGKKYKYKNGGQILDDDQEESFQEWMNDGNVVSFEKGVYSTQDAQYSNKLKGMDELRKYFKKEFLSDSYKEGGWIQRPIKIKKDVYQFKDQNGVGYIVKRGVGERITPMWIVSNDEEGSWDGSHEPFYTKKSAEEYIESFFAKGGSIDVETYDYNSLVGKYANLYSMGVSLPSEHRIEGVMFSSPNFRYRYLTLKFDRGIAPIPINEINAFLNNEIIYVNDNKEEYGIQLIPNQFAKGGKTANTMKLEDYETASMSMGGYEDGAINANPTEFAKGGGVDLPKANKMFHLPLELAVYVPSTQDVDKVISESELKERVDEVSAYLARLFGGFTKSDKVGGFMASNSELVTEDVVPVVSFATKDAFEANKNKLVNKLSEWAKRWGQEAIGFEFEGDLYYVPEKFANGGGVDSKREYLENRLWNERGYDYPFLNKLSFKELRSLYDTEFYYDEIYAKGGEIQEKKKVSSYKQLENHPLVDYIEREYNAGAFDDTDYSYWLYLKDGYVFSDLESTQLHEDSKGDLVRAFNEEKVFKKPSESNKKTDTDSFVGENNYRISVSENDKYIGEYPNPIASLIEAKTIFAQLETKYKRPQYLISVFRRPTSTSGYEKINVDEWYAYSEGFEKGGDVRDMSWYQDFKKDQLKKGTKHEMEHIDTIKQFKKKGVSDKEVAQAIAQDHLDENDSYYIELEKMEGSSKKLSDAIKEFEKHRGHRKNAHKFKLGGFMGREKEIIHVVFNTDVKLVIREKNGKYITESIFPKDSLLKFTFRHNDGKNTTLEFANTGMYIVVPNEKIEVVGFNEQKFGNGGSVKPYQSMPINENDKQIMTLLTKIEDPLSFTSSQKQKLSTFKGINVVNELSNSLIQKIYGLLFKYHNVEHPIKELFLSNVGAGNIVSYAPNYIEKLMIDFDERNRFVSVEKEINSIVNSTKKYILFSEEEIRNMDAIIHVYPETNPPYEQLNLLLYKTDKPSVALGVCEFTSKEKLNEFKVKVGTNQGAFAQNQMMMYKQGTKYIEVNEGISDEGSYTLIYILTKMS